MSKAQIKPPDEFWENPSVPHPDFDVWVKRFEMFCAITKPASEKNNLLFMLGTHGYTMAKGKVESMPEDATVAEVKTALRQIFKPEASPVVRRLEFMRMNQLAHETAHEYGARLRAAASACNFKTITEDMILTDRFIAGCSNNSIKSKLIGTADLTFNKAIEIVSNSMAAQANAQHFGTNAPVNFVRQKQTFNKSSHGSSGHSQQNIRSGSGSFPPSGGMRCFGCGKPGHRVKDKNCPAFGKECHKCKKPNHFASQCKTKTVSEVKCESDQGNVEIIEVVSSVAVGRPEVLVEVGPSRQQMTFLLDTGSQVTLIPASEVVRLGLTVLPVEDNFALSGYGGASIEPKGMAKTVLTSIATGQSCEAKVIVTAFGSSILGMDVIDPLGLVSFNFSVETEPPKPIVSGVGVLVGFQHKIKLRDSNPVHCRARTVPLALENEVREELERMERDGIIVADEELEWLSPIHPVRKASGKLRLTVDLRALNKQIVIVQHPLPQMELLTNKFGTAKIFSSLDLKGAFNQVPMHAESQKLLGIATPFGNYRFLRLPFGLASAPAVFQSIMDKLLKGLPGVLWYLDDIVVFGDSKAEHDQRLNSVLVILEKAGLCLEPDKCHIAQSEIAFLGHKVSGRGIAPLNLRSDFNRPNDAKGVKSFVGFLGFYRRFLPNFSELVEPLADLLHKGVDFFWGPEQEQAFMRVQQLLESAELANFRQECQCIVTTDASNVGIGAVLTQQDGEIESPPVAYFSKRLQKAQRNYSTGEKETLAIVEALERWYPLLYGRRFLVRTDHSALLTLLTPGGSGRTAWRIQRWGLRLLPFTFDLEFVRSQDNPADYLSRFPSEELHSKVSDPCEETVLLVDAAMSVGNDPILGQVKQNVSSKWPRKVPVGDALRPFWDVRTELTYFEEKDVLLKGLQIVPPVEQRQELLLLAHEGHLGVVRTKRALRDRFWWPRIGSDVEAMIKQCSNCLLGKPSFTQVPVQAIPVQERPFA